MRWTMTAVDTVWTAPATWRPADWPDRWPGDCGARDWRVLAVPRLWSLVAPAFRVSPPYGLAAVAEVPVFSSAAAAMSWCRRQDRRLAGPAGAELQRKLREAARAYELQLSRANRTVTACLAEPT